MPRHHELRSGVIAQDFDVHDHPDTAGKLHVLPFELRTPLSKTRSCIPWTPVAFGSITGCVPDDDCMSEPFFELVILRRPSPYPHRFPLETYRPTPCSGPSTPRPAGIQPERFL